MKKILVFGATGQQGGATARQLLSHGFQVRAFTRSIESESAQNLQKLGAEIFQGDMGNEASLEAAMKAIYGVFSVQPPSWTPTLESDSHEAKLGILVADVAKRSGVQHLIYSSVLGSDLMDSFRPFFKHAIEEHIWKLQIPATVFRPAGFMENYRLPQVGLSDGKIYDPTRTDLPTPFISVEDIGVFVRIAFQKPKEFLGQTINLAGDVLSISKVAEILSAHLGRKITHVQVPIEAVKQQSLVLGELMSLINANGCPEVDLRFLRSFHPDLMNFETWLKNSGLK